MNGENVKNGIAVIGIACRFPGAGDKDMFWENLKTGVESITRFSDQELEDSGIAREIYNQPAYVRKGFVIDDEDKFDAAFFEYSPREAKSMDPQHRLFLETAWKALEDGGYPPGECHGSVGMFAGSKISTYLLNLLDEGKSLYGTAAGYQTLIGNDKDYLVTRASYKLNLKGPSVAVQCACSTSLVAVHFACESVLSGACNMALAGGVSVSVPQKAGYVYQEGMMFSPDGHCRAFDEQARGMMPGNGVGVVLLKNLEKALQDNDHIYAVVRGTAVNNDGSNKTGYTAPSVEGQSKVIREAISIAEIDCESISYVETHGTGTELGDPIEIESISDVFKSETDKKGFCAIGSVKTNIGHLDTAAGIASFIKTALSLEHAQIPPSLNFLKPNSKIDFENTPFFVNTKLSKWHENGTPKRAGVSSFGFGGTNAHVILEQAPKRSVETQKVGSPMHLLTLSAKTPDALEQQIQNYESFLNNREFFINDVCFTANTGRSHFKYRFAAIAASLGELRRLLSAVAQGKTASNVFAGVADTLIQRKISFDLSGQSNETDEPADICSDTHLLKPCYKLPLSRTDKDGYLLTLSALGNLYVRGASIDWKAFYHGSRPYRVTLPTYPFERKRYWAGKTDISVATEFDTDSTGRNAFHEVLWQEKEYPTVGDNLSEKPGTWLIFADKGGVGLLLAEKLRSHGNECVLVFTDNVTAKFSHVFTSFDFKKPKAYQELVETFQERSGCCGIIHLWALDAVSSENMTSEWLQASQDLVCGSVFRLVQSMRDLKWPGPPPRLCLVTQGAQPVDGKDAPIAVTQAPIWGLGKVIGVEHPELDCLRLDMDPVDAKLDVNSIFNELYALDPESQVAFRANRRYVPRIVKTQIESTSDKENSPGIFYNDATYLITGGLGALGIEITRWMADQKAGHIVLVSRSQPGEQVNHTLAALRKKIDISVFSADVTDPDQLADVFTAIEKNHPTIKGIIHAAGVLEPGASLDNEKYDNYLKVTAPKIQGAWNLHQLSKSFSLDFFICFSSVVSMWGIHGMASYTAANMFLDALSHYRRSMGLKGTTINWGPWSDIGVVAEYNMSERLAIQGIGTISPAQGISFLEKVIHNDFNQIGVLRANWHKIIKQYQNKAERKLFHEVETSQADDSTLLEKIPDILTRLRKISSSKRVPVLLDYLQDQVSKILRVSKSKILESDNLMQLGMDSLLFLELARIMETDLEIRIPPRYFIQSPHIGTLGKFLIENMGDLDTDYNKSKEDFFIVFDPDNRYEPFGLTDIQQAYWIGRANTLELGNIACHVYMEIDALHLDHARYNQAWQVLIQRHEMLRAVILPEGFQKILETVPDYKINIADLTGKSPEQAEAALASTRDFMSHQVLDPEIWPIFDIKISRIDNETSKIHLSLDMLVVDALSVSQLMKELALLYQDESASLPPLELSFRDYVLAEKQYQGSALFETSKAYWMNRLTQIPPGPELPLIKNPGDVTSPHFKRRTLRLKPDTWKQLKSKAANAGLTASGLLLSCYAEILSTWSKTARFTINMTIFNRLPVHPQVNNLIGDFTSLIMLVVDAGGQNSFIERAQKIQSQFWRDVEYRHFSGVRVLRELSRIQSGNISMPVVFTSNIVYGDRDEIRSDSSVIGEVVYTVTQTPQVWLDLQITEQGNTLVLDWDAVEELFPEGLLDDMFNAYHLLLNRLAVSDDWHVTWDLMPADQVLQRKDINATAQPIFPETLNSLFIKQAEQRPDHTAVVTSSGRISYKDLRHKSMVFASLLAARGATANTLVAVVMEKGWEQVVAVLGILNSGAAYLPIDPSVPKERLWLLLKDGGVGLVLTQSWLAEELEWPENTERFSVDEQGYADQDNIPIDILQTPDDLAYVIYTSGSTGLPKGVMVNHRGAVNTILDVNKRFSIEPRDRVLAMSNLNFDLSVFDIFGALAVGGTIVMPDPSGVKDPGHWLELMKREKITIWNSVPQFMKMLVEYVSGGVDSVPESLRLALLSGDWIPLDLPDQIRAVSKNVQLISLGGATEASIWSILYPINNVNPRWKSIPYGRPMTNQKIYVLSEKMKACPNWVTGQLYISGIGLAKGYWKDNGQTNASFIIHPETKERLYKTGDLGKYLPDGNIELIGRDDFQVKINGYRIELGEVEAAVKQFNGIDEAIVKTFEGNRVNKQLTAYVRLHEGLSLDKDALKAFLKKKLPSYLIPFDFVVLDAFPLNSNGKIDRKLLQPPVCSVYTDSDDDSPQTFLESEIIEICSRLLKISNICAKDSFFELGGDSLLGIRFINLLRDKYQIELPLRSLFDEPKLSKIANRINATRMTAANINLEKGVI